MIKREANEERSNQEIVLSHALELLTFVKKPTFGLYHQNLFKLLASKGIHKLEDLTPSLFKSVKNAAIKKTQYLPIYIKIYFKRLILNNQNCIIKELIKNYDEWL